VVVIWSGAYEFIRTWKARAVGLRHEYVWWRSFDLTANERQWRRMFKGQNISVCDLCQQSNTPKSLLFLSCSVIVLGFYERGNSGAAYCF